MKISQMLEREDFYSINEKTLNSYFSESDKETTLFIYPRLNAIVTKKPSLRVMEYLLCEYSVRKGPIKWLAIRSYVLCCLWSFGLLSAKKCLIRSNVETDTLVYPCNKKYRIFHFANNTVDVIPKYGFDDSGLMNEISFRKQDRLPDFVPRIVSYSEKGYREQIIDGRPLARVSVNFEELRDQAYYLLNQYEIPQRETVMLKPYADTLVTKIHSLSLRKIEDNVALDRIIHHLVSLVDADAPVILSFSHGDLQPGNIWVENTTRRIYIIDWESWGTRSIWYDKATLYQGLRPEGIQHYLTKDIPLTERVVVLLEDIVFQLHELNSLPDNFGISKFKEYCKTVEKWIDLGDNHDERDSV